MSIKKPSIFIIEDDVNVSQSLRWLFESVNYTVETFTTATEYLSVHDPNRFGCLLIDIRLPDMSGLKLQERLVKMNNSIPIIFITGHGDVVLAVRAMQLGAKDFILKPFDNQLLLEKIQEILVDSAEPHTAYQKFINCLNALTSREIQILDLIVQGKLNKQIAAEMKISMSTVEQHRAHIMQKMKVKTLAELVKLNSMFRLRIGI